MSVVEHAMRSAALSGEVISGDRGLVVGFDGGALVAAIDGLGHGPEANAAAEAAIEVLSAQPELSPGELVERCHARLRTTRGAVISLATFDAKHGAMTWLGVGNVDGVLVRSDLAKAPGSDIALATRGGTVGFNLPPLHPRTLPVRPGDTLVFATDGIRLGFRSEVTRERTPDQIAEVIMSRFAKPSDDACVVVARYIAQDAPLRGAVG